MIKPRMASMVAIRTRAGEWVCAAGATRAAYGIVPPALLFVFIFLHLDTLAA